METLKTRTKDGKLRRVSYLESQLNTTHRIRFQDGDKETFMTCQNKQSAQYIREDWNRRVKDEN